MKKMILGMALALMAIVPATAQQKKALKNLTPEQAVKVKANRMAKRMMLDDATTAKFIPLYKEYLGELNECTKNCPATAGCPLNPRNGQAVSEADIEKHIEQCMQQQQKRLDIRKEYYGKFKKILNMNQIQALFCGRKGDRYQCCGKPCVQGKRCVAPKKGQRQGKRIGMQN